MWTNPPRSLFGTLTYKMRLCRVRCFTDSIYIYICTIFNGTYSHCFSISLLISSNPIFSKVLKVFLVVVVGFYYSCATTAYAVLGLRKWEGSATVSEVPKKTSGTAALPFSPELVDFLSKGLALTGAISIAASKMNNEYANLLRTIFMTFATFFGYVWGARLPAAFTKIVHPLIISTAVTHVFTQITALATSSTFKDVLATYKSGTMKLLATGAGDILL